MSSRRVVVTGVGVVSALGLDAAAFWDSLTRGRPAIGPIERVDRSRLRFENGAEVRGFEPQKHFERKQLAQLDRFCQFALVAAREAVAASGLEWTEESRIRGGVVTGSSVGGQDTTDETFVNLYAEKRTRAQPLVIPRVMPNASASQISMEFGLAGPAFTTSTACSSANHAIGHAFWMIRGGLIDTAITGGSEAPFSYGNLKSWEALRVVAPDTCRPFSKQRRGMILGEGGAMMVLESYESATSRGADILAEIVGFGMSADAGHLTHPSDEGAARAMQAALADASLDASDVGYVSAHGTGTTANDPMETRAIRCVFGPDADRLAVSATKSMHGHALGASSALEGVATVLALNRGILPPTANFIDPDPECDLDVIPNQSRERVVGFAISNSFAFGGLNATLAFRRWT